MVGFEQRYKEKIYILFVATLFYFVSINYKMTGVLIKLHKDTHVLFLETAAVQEGFYSCA